MKAAEETESLEKRHVAEQSEAEEDLCIVAVAHSADLESEEIPEYIQVQGTFKYQSLPVMCILHITHRFRSSDPGVCAGGNQCIVGTLDVVADYSASGEVLKGHDSRALYMINVCVANVARRRGVGQKLVAAAMEFAKNTGVYHHSGKCLH